MRLLLYCITNYYLNAITLQLTTLQHEISSLLLYYTLMRLLYYFATYYSTQ